MAISKLSRPYPSAARVTEQMCESSLFKSRKFPFEVADRSVCRRVPQQHCLSPSACYYVMTRAMSCDTLPLCVGGGGGGGEMGVGVRVCVCVSVCGSPVPILCCTWFHHCNITRIYLLCYTHRTPITLYYGISMVTPNYGAIHNPIFLQCRPISFT